MHFEILVEDSSGGRLVQHLMPKLIGPHADPHTWKVHSYRGIGRVPPGLRSNSDPARRILLDQLPRLLRGYARTPGYDAIVVIVDSDRRDCREFLAELRRVSVECGAEAISLFRLAIEEIEAWYLGDHHALVAAYPGVRKPVLDTYVQDSVCGTWELLAKATYPRHDLEGRPYGAVGSIKHEWADRIGPLMEPDRNHSPSFRKLCEGLRRLVANAP